MSYSQVITHFTSQEFQSITSMIGKFKIIFLTACVNWLLKTYEDKKFLRVKSSSIRVNLSRFEILNLTN